MKHELPLIVMTYVYFIYYDDDDENLDVVITGINCLSLINQGKYKI